MKLTQIRFKSGKYANRTYLSVWEENPDYFYWMAGQFGTFWSDIVKQLEKRDEQINKSKPLNLNFPSVEKVKQIFLLNPICGFDMSGYICEIYSNLADERKNEYYQSLLYRNKIVLK